MNLSYASSAVLNMRSSLWGAEVARLVHVRELVLVEFDHGRVELGDDVAQPILAGGEGTLENRQRVAQIYARERTARRCRRLAALGIERDDGCGREEREIDRDDGDAIVRRGAQA